jgi:hypothetical protein
MSEDSILYNHVRGQEGFDIESRMKNTHVLYAGYMIPSIKEATLLFTPSSLFSNTRLQDTFVLWERY